MVSQCAVLSQGERAVWWDTVAVFLCFSYYYCYESAGLFWTLGYLVMYPYLLDCVVTKAAPFLDDKVSSGTPLYLPHPLDQTNHA